MMEFFVSGQRVRVYTPVIAADSLRYLTARFHFTDGDWDGSEVWAHFRQGETVYDIALDENGELTADKELNLTVGEWELYLTGTRDGTRLTTVPLILTVRESGLVDAPLHPMPLSVAEQVDYKAGQALLLAQALKEAAERGDFNGRDGTSFAVTGYFRSLEALRESVPEPGAGEAYGVGEQAPYDIYVWDALHGDWVNNGKLQGPQGQRGVPGVTFLPSIDGNGNLSWSNDGGLENPATHNVTGPRGADGAKGETGPGAYEKAVEAGYTGTAATFYQALTAMPYHNKRHLPDGADPILVKTGNLGDGAVTAAKIAYGAVLCNSFFFTLQRTAWGQNESGSYELTATLSSVYDLDPAKHVCFLGLRKALAFSPGDGNSAQSWTPTDLETEKECFGCLYGARLIEKNTVKFVASELPPANFQVQLMVFHR